MSKSQIAWNITINSNLNRSKNQNGNMFFGLRQKGLLLVRNSIFHKHFVVCESLNILDSTHSILSNSLIGWNKTTNNDYRRYWIYSKYECEVYKFKFKSFKAPKWKYLFQFMTKRTISGSKLNFTQTFWSMWVF